MRAPYTYVRIGGAYYCLQQNPVVLAWFLYVKNQAFCLGSLGVDKRKAASVVRSYVGCWLGSRGIESLLPLPVYGNLCLPVHRGYRVFDLRRRTAVKVFGPEVDQALIAREIEGVRRASVLECAPTIRRWSIEEGWYEEDLAIGQLGHLAPEHESLTVIARYRRDIEPCILGLVSLQAPLSLDLGEYLDEITGELQSRELVGRVLDAGSAGLIDRFIQLSIRRLRPCVDQKIDLVFSHGDFSLVNVLDTEKGTMVVDWESAGRRSALFDLYNYFLTEVYYERATVNLYSEVTEAILSLQLNLASRGVHLVGGLQCLAPVYRWLYYLERVFVLLEREPSKNQVDVIVRSVDVFERYEEAVAAGWVGVQNCESGRS